GLHYNLTREEECRVARIRGCWRNRNLLDFRLLTGWELLVDQRLTRAVETPPGNTRSRDAFDKAMDRAEIDNFLETMYASGLAAQQTVVNPETLALSQSEVPVALPMPHHSHLGGDGLPVVQAGANVDGGKKGSATTAPQKEKVPANRGGPHKEKTVPPAETVTVQKRARQGPSKAPLVEEREAPASDLEFMTDGEREFLFHLCEQLGFGGLAGISRPTAIDQSPFSAAFGHLSVGLHEMFLSASKQPRVERELREEIQGLERELAEARDRLAEVERRLTKGDCDAADARGKLAVDIKLDLERNDQVAKLERDISLLQERVAAKDKKIDILQRESSVRLTEVKKLEGEVACLRAEGSRAAAAAVEAFKQSADYKNAMNEAAKARALANVEMLKQKGAIGWVKVSQPNVPPAQNAPPAKGV
ncbi:hypothetical protein ABKV19_013357, partial [Rosa sericea]